MPLPRRETVHQVIVDSNGDNIQCEGTVVPIDSIVIDPNNARLHPEESIEVLMQSLRLYGQRVPLVVRAQDRKVAAGNGRLTAARRLGWKEIAISVRPMTDNEFYGFALVDNRAGEKSQWDLETLSRVQQLLTESEHGGIGWTDEELQMLRTQMYTPPVEVLKVTLAERFGVPPFSVLDARQGYWQDRKRAWLALGIQSELGRGNTPTTSARVGADEGGSLLPAMNLVDGHTVRGDGKGRPIDNGLLGFSEQARSHYKAGTARTKGSGGPAELSIEFKQRKAIPGGSTGANSCYLFKTADGYKSANDNGLAAQTGTSIFDPVLCELAYRWFCPPGGQILDPFAGGSVRGIVAAKLGRHYVGTDLSPLQVAANEMQADAIVPDNKPQWVVADALTIPALAAQGVIPDEYDFIKSCPPYFDLEAYSDNPDDLSAMPWEEFVETYYAVIAGACGLLKDNRFACFCVGDVRDRATGNYRGLPGVTIAAFKDAGLELYNEAILVTAVGSLSIRVGKQFANYRKLGRTHQVVQVFVKGDWRAASAAVGPVEMGEVDGLEIAEGAVDVAD